MKDKLYQYLSSFLKTHHHKGAPLVLALSGGPDSSALLYTLMKFKDLDLHLAHIDHNWRKSSKAESLALKRLAKELNCPFHLLCAEPPTQASNLEDEARQVRRDFLLKVAKEIGAEAILFAHQADDQAETVLKRLLEGASLMSLGGMTEVAKVGRIFLWRPFLRLRKKEILQWLTKNEKTFFIDPTNEERRFLRGRMRVDIFPSLEESFGKSIGKNLHLLGEGAREVAEYLAKKVAPVMQQTKEGADSLTLNIKPYLPLESLELKMILSALNKEQGLDLSREELSLFSKTILSGKPLKKMRGERVVFSFSRGVIKIGKT